MQVGPGKTRLPEKWIFQMPGNTTHRELAPKNSWTALGKRAEMSYNALRVRKKVRAGEGQDGGK
jgi:hypothetical protein